METKKIIVDGECAFTIPTRSFSIGESATGYTLHSSVGKFDSNGVEQQNWEQYGTQAIPANKQHDVVFIPAGRNFRLMGNVGKVIVTY